MNVYLFKPLGFTTFSECKIERPIKFWFASYFSNRNDVGYNDMRLEILNLFLVKWVVLRFWLALIVKMYVVFKIMGCYTLWECYTFDALPIHDGFSSK